MRISGPTPWHVCCLIALGGEGAVVLTQTPAVGRTGVVYYPGTPRWGVRHPARGHKARRLIKLSVEVATEGVYHPNHVPPTLAKRVEAYANLAWAMEARARASQSSTQERTAAPL